MNPPLFYCRKELKPVRSNFFFIRLPVECSRYPFSSEVASILMGEFEVKQLVQLGRLIGDTSRTDKFDQTQKA